LNSNDRDKLGFGKRHETENKVRLGLSRIIPLKEKVPERDYARFTEKLVQETRRFVIEVHRSS
jgi:hypothetical protein